MKGTNLHERYELREILGRGGMGVVYRALDKLMKREVALKTILDIENPSTLQLFYKEWSVLATMVHPNVINIYDIGEFEQDGAKKPFFVMPLLPGVTLDKLIKDGSPRLTVAGVIEIVSQASHGLHAAHEQGLVHRDVKPSNIFVMDDNSVKIIDFGIAREASGQSRTTLKGTLYYIAPEQLQLKPPSAASDLFALGVVTYESLTRRRPFQGTNEGDVIEAILHHSPPPISDINHEVSYAISQVVHKAMAKQPWHRFASTREFADALQKALRNEALDYFDAGKIKPRLERAAKSFEAGDYVFATEVLSELEAEGHLDQEIALLRGQVDQAIKQTRIHQMLESARRFFEATEYPLALRKIQEALELDPNDAGALTLKAAVEKERRERKISEWIALARRHMENQAFRQAREALDNVVQIKPNETEALELLAEVKRRENEISRLREEKSRLYHDATQSWEKGEVTAALSKLELLVSMDRNQPEADAGRSSTYQNFYNQVHSEHNTLKNCYEEAKRLLAADNFEAAMAICRQYLSKYPNHTLFQALKFDVDERQRQKLSQVVAETDRRVEEEPDLDKRAAILEEALKLYPGESHFERAIRLVRDKRDLVNSIVAKAHYFEERGQFNDALDQWQILKSIHEKQPGLAFEIQRLAKRRDQQAHENSKARWVEQADKYLEGGDYKRALQTVESALAEFPGEPELLELEKLVRKSQERGSQALERLIQARAFSESGAHEEALAALRESYNLDPRNTVIRTVLMNSLLEKARRVVDEDWPAAHTIVQEVLDMEPTHAPAQSLASRIADRQRDDSIAACLTQARRLQTEGDIEGAATVVKQALATYPNEPRLQQLQTTLKRARVPRTTSSIPVPAAPAAPDDQTVLLTGGITVPGAPSPQPSAPASPTSESPLADSVSGILAAPPTGPVPPIVPPADAARIPPAGAVPPPVPPVTPRPPLSDQSRILLAGTATAVALLLVVALLVTYMRHHKSQPSTGPKGVVAKLQIAVHTVPEGAEIKVNGEVCGTPVCRLQLAPGTYPAEAHLTGFQPATSNITVAAGAAPDFTLTLSPLPPRVVISTDLPDGTVSLDGTATTKIQVGAAEIPNLGPGQHTVAVQGGDSSASIPVEITPGALPKLAGTLEAKNLRAFLVAGYGSDAHVYAGGTGYRVTLDGKPLGDLGIDGMPLQGLAPGTHELALDSQNSQHDKIVFESQPSATLYVSLGASQNVGTLILEANQDQAHIYLNGEKTKRDTVRGRVMLPLAPKQYRVSVQKDGFAAVPEQLVDIKRGVESRLSFILAPPKSTLIVRQAPPNTEVLLDGKSLGTANASGEFQIGNIDPGSHKVILRHENYRPLQIDEIFLSTKPVELQGALEAMNGTIRFDVTAGVEAHITYRRDGDSQEHEVSGTNASVPDGHYTVTASAPQFQTVSTSVTLAPGGTVTATLPMRRIEAPKAAPKAPPPAPTFGLEDWAKGGLWHRDGNMITHTGGNYVLAPLDIAQGSVRFTAVLRKGKKIEWVVGYRDERNFILYQLEDKGLTRTQVVNGNKTSQPRTAYAFDHKEPVSITVTIAPHSIAVSISRGGQWVPLDDFQISGAPVHGKFGFHIPGSDEIGLLDFHLAPN